MRWKTWKNLLADPIIQTEVRAQGQLFSLCHQELGNLVSGFYLVCKSGRSPSTDNNFIQLLFLNTLQKLFPSGSLPGFTISTWLPLITVAIIQNLITVASSQWFVCCAVILSQCVGAYKCRMYTSWLLHSSQGLCECTCVCSFASDALQPHGLSPTRLLCPWNFPGKNIGASCHFLLLGIFPTQGSNPGLLHLLHWQMDSLPLAPYGKPPVYLYIVSLSGHLGIYRYVCLYIWFIHNNLLSAKHWTKCLSTQQSRCYCHHPYFPYKKTEGQRIKVTCLISLSPASGEARVWLWWSDHAFH